MNLQSICLALAALFVLSNSTAQEYHFIQFKDKAGSTYSIDRPEEFLSARSIERRKRQKIRITQRDLPVNSTYLSEVANLGADVIYSSRWFNAALIELNEGVNLRDILSSPNVSGIYESNRFATTNSSLEGNLLDSDKSTAGLYGAAEDQVRFMGINAMHAAGYTGKGLMVAVFDGGFVNVGSLKYFENTDIRSTYDFVANNEDVYDAGSHGLGVLSCMAAVDSGTFIGGLPDATYHLFQTEDVNRERKVEEIYWIIAAERADSLGVDLINSSLGYSNFDVKSESYVYKDLDGQKPLITQAANLAAQVGIVVVTSAGNEGNSSWKYISAPADAEHVIAVGALGYTGEKAGFSSFGPTADDRIKPDVSAVGRNVTVVSPTGRLKFSNGTSFASPLTACIIGGAMQAYPEKSAMEILKLVRQSAQSSTTPDNKIGYGRIQFTDLVPVDDELIAQYDLRITTTFGLKEKLANTIFMRSPGQKGTLNILLEGSLINEPLTFQIFDNEANFIEKVDLPTGQSHIKYRNLNLKPGIYTVNLWSGESSTSKKVYLR